nr:hypothetical protein [Tanacetum cinerariifolium]
QDYDITSSLRRGALHHMIVVNNQRDSVSPPLLAIKPKKGKSQTVTSTFLKSQGLKASGALFQKSKRPKSKQPPTDTIVTLPKPTEGSKDITSTTLDEGTTKTTPRPEGSLRDKDSEGNIPPANMEPIHTLVVNPSGTEKESDEEEVLPAGDDMDEDSSDDTEEQHEEAAVSYANLKASIEEYYKENIAHQDQTDQLVASSMSFLDKSSSSISDLYKGLNVITELLKDINNAVKDDPATNKKINEAIKTFAKISAQTTEILSLTALKRKVTSLRQDTSKIKSMMVEIYHAFKARPSSALLGSVTPTLALTHIPANVEGENPLTFPLKNLFPTLRGRLKTQQWPF